MTNKELQTLLKKFPDEANMYYLDNSKARIMNVTSLTVTNKYCPPIESWRHIDGSNNQVQKETLHDIKSILI